MRTLFAAMLILLSLGAAAEESGRAVRILPPQRDVAPNLFQIRVEVDPPVTRVEFWVEGKRVMARNAPPYSVELDLGKLPKRVEIRAKGFDKDQRLVAEDTFVVNERDASLENFVELPVSVSDAAGNPLTDLAHGDFTVFENGQPQKIASFRVASELPISAGMLFDHSGRKDKRKEAARMEAARSEGVAFLRRMLKEGDRAFVSAMDASRGTPFVSEVALLEAQVEAIPEAGRGTALYDAILTGLYRFRNVQGRKALIVVTEGGDTASRMDYPEMVAYARASRVPLYFVGIGFLIADGKLKSLAAETGGNAYFVRNVNQLPEAYKKLEEDLRSQYWIAYQAESSNAEYREVEVKVNRSDAKVRTIRGYLP